MKHETNKIFCMIIILLIFYTQFCYSYFIAAAVNPVSTTISQYTTYQLILYRSNDPVQQQFISPIFEVPSTAYIQLKLPTSYVAFSNTTFPTCWNERTNVSLACMANLETNVITINNMFTSNGTRNAATLYILINGIKNPSRAQSSGNFQYFIKYQNGTIIDQSPATGYAAVTFTSATFMSCAISTTGTVSTRSKLTFTLTLRNSIPTSGVIKIEVPTSWNGDLDSSLTVVSTPTCTGIQGLGQLTCGYQIDTGLSVMRITVSSLSTSSIAAGTTIIFDVASILTPPYINSQDLIKIYSQWSDSVTIDSCSSKVTGTVSIPFTSMIFSVLSGTTVVQSKFSGKLTLTLSRSFYYLDQIRLKVPSNFLTNNQIVVGSSNYAVFTVTVQPQSSTVILSNFPASPTILPAGNIFSLVFTDVYNYQSTQPQSITATFYRNQQKYQQSSTTYTSTIGTFTSVSLVSDNSFVNYIGGSMLTVNSQFYMPVGAYIEIVYNSAITVDNLASEPVTSSALNGVRVNSVTYNVQLSVITVSNLFQSKFTNGTIQVKIPTFKNPPTLRPTPYTISFKSATSYSIASSTFNFQASLQPFKSATATLTASSYKVMDSVVIYTISFETYYDYNSVSVLIPPQIITNSGFQSSCSPNTYTSCSISTVTTTGYTGYNNLTFTGSHSAGLQSISWGNNYNPNSFKPTSNFQVYTYLGGWGVQKSTGYTTLTMTQQAEILSAQVVPSSYTNDASISLQISYILPARTPTGTVTITVPQIIDITRSVCSGTNIGTCTIISPRVVISFINSDTSTTHSSIVRLAGTKNSPSFKPISSFTILLLSSDNYKSLASTVSAWTNTATSSFTATVTSDVGYRGQNALFTFALSGLSGTQSFVNIRINPNFKKLTTAPSGGSLIGDYQVRFNIPGQSSIILSITLQAPVAIGDYTFSFRTFTIDQFLMGQSISDVWRHSCFGTQCRACNGATCLNCYNSTITQFYIFNTADSTCTRACTLGYFLAPNTTNCIPCSSNCLECTNTATTCTECPIYTNTTPSTIYYLNTIFSTCVLQCSAGYYPNNFTQACSPCIQPCNTCQNDNICLTCISSYYLLNTTQTCESDCPANFMVKNSINRTCDYCSSNCLTCSIFVYNCTSCNNSQSLYLDVNVCVTQCSTQKFLKDNICTSCQPPCRICHNSTTTCSACFPNSTLSLWFQFKCISPSECSIGNFVNSVNGSCDACPSQCLQCISLTNCSSCADSFYLYANKCIATCPNITYKEDSIKQCLPCVGCVTCTSSTLCTSCKNIEYLYLSACLTTCPNITFASSETVTISGTSVNRKICTLCPTGCPTCSNASYCLSCLTQQYLYKGVCYTNCPISTYPSSPNCVDCPPTCKTCTSPSNCLTCVTNYSLQNAQCVLNCNPGISVGQVCYPCGLNCSVCQNTTCTRCDTGYLLQNNVCVTACSIDMVAIDTMVCRVCSTLYVNCSTCNTTHCLSCFDGELTNGQCLPCSPGYYTHNSKCVLCPSQCNLCMNQTYCTSCSTNYYLQANFCVNPCPNNKIPNGTKCDVCVPNCAKCNLQTKGCLICNAGLFQFQGNCLQSCPDPYVINLNYTLCITKQQYAQQYSKASKPIYFPFTIATIIFIVIAVILKCYTKDMHIITFLVSVIAWLELFCWLVFGLIQYFFYKNLQDNALKGILLVLGAVGFLVFTNLIFLRCYCKYFTTDVDFIKWEKQHSCANKVFVIFSSIFTFRFHRISYSKLLHRQQLSLQLSSIKKLTPINIISILSILTTSTAIIVATCLALYYSLNIDQQFFNALDTLIVTGLQVLLMLLDLRHSHNYFIDSLETQNIKNKIFGEDYEEFSINGRNRDGQKGDKYKVREYYNEHQKGSNISRENLLGEGVDSSGNIMDQITTTKKFRVGKNLSKEQINQEQIDQGGQTLRDGNFIGGKSKGGKLSGTGLGGTGGNGRGQGSKLGTGGSVLGQGSGLGTGNDPNTQQIQYNEQDLQQDILQPPKTLWQQKKFDPHGYLIKHDQLNNTVLYDQNGYKVQIDEKGKHHKYNQQGYEMIYDEKKEKWVPHDKDGFIVSDDGKRYDERGFEVRKGDGNGPVKFFDADGFEIIKDQNGKEIKIDQKGNRVQVDPITKQIKAFNKQGYQILYGSDGQSDKFINPQTSNHIRLNQKGVWQQYDPKDNFLLVKNPQTGKYEKFDEYGFKIQYDQYGNFYRYDNQGNRVVIRADGTMRRFDKEGYEIKRDPLSGQVIKYDKDGYIVKVNPQTGQKTFFDSNGYRVQRDFYNNPTLYDSQDNLIVIDPKTGIHHKYNKQGLQICKDQKGNTYLKDKRGRKVVELDDGYYQKFDEVGNKIWLDGEGCQVETDENGNIVRYDKIGDVVQEDQEDEDEDPKKKKNEDGQFYIEQQQGDNAMAVAKKPKPQKKSNKFKISKQYNFQQQYSKMIQQDKPHLLFNFQDQQLQGDENLKQFHDVEPVNEYQLQRQYQTLYNMETENQWMKRDRSSGAIGFKLEDLGDIDNTPYKNLREKIKGNKSKLNTKIEQTNQNKSQIVIEPQQNQQKLQLKSVADMSVSRQSYQNQGIQPLQDKQQNNKNNKKLQDDLESLEEIDTGRVNVTRNIGNQRSQAKFERASQKDENKSNFNRKNSEAGGVTRSEKNLVKSQNQNAKKKQKTHKIFDSDQQVVSLGQQQNWQNQTPQLFYKQGRNSNTHANTNTQNKLFDDQQSDILSDYIPQQPENPSSMSKGHKASEQNLFHNKYMQSIQEVEDQLFEKLKSQDNRVKRTQFKLSGKPNPLVQYAKTIDAKKWQDEKDRGQDRDRYGRRDKDRQGKNNRTARR